MKCFMVVDEDQDIIAIFNTFSDAEEFADDYNGNCSVYETKTVPELWDNSDLVYTNRH